MAEGPQRGQVRKTHSSDIGMILGRSVDSGGQMLDRRLTMFSVLACRVGGRRMTKNRGFRAAAALLVILTLSGCATGMRRIIGGDPVAQGEMPWVVQVLHRNSSCGGVLISQDLVLTAAHCLFDRNDRRLRAQDYTTITGSIVFGEGLRRRVIRTIPHPQYNNQTNANDIALLSLEPDPSQTHATLSEWGDPSFLAPGTGLVVAGWGLTEYDEPSRSLLMATVPLSSSEACSNFWGNREPGAFCAGGGPTDSCNGDSGGPIMHRIGPGRFQLLGVVSFGVEDCGRPGAPAVYARLAAYAPWIEGNR